MLRRLPSLLIAVGAVVVTASYVHALPSSEVALTLRPVAARSVYGGEPDVLGLDVTIAAPRGDVLDALVVRQNGTAQWQVDLTDAVLWADAGATGFQGIGIDRKLSSGSWVASENGWVLDRVFEPIAADGTRFFVTTSVVATPTGQATVQLSIPTYRDAFTPASYDRGDLGVFLRTARTAPRATVTNAGAHALVRTTTDSLAPIVRITEPKDGVTLDRDWFIVRGVARDAGGSAPARVRVSINRVGKEATWVDAVPEAAQFATWEARLFELPRGETFELRVMGEDWVGNRSTVSEPVRVTLTK